ncbi:MULTISPECIES: EamA family transporter RarD [unclassified Acinetobacter]|uniref:EamA family transporter RarD n=1 Tax=unclassified Acinetobacter TaxID=196816 RepID=UPI0035BB3131
MNAKTVDRTGLIQILSCYLIWGLFPLYWYPLVNYPADQLLAHRIVWGSLFAMIAVVLTTQSKALWQALTNKKVLLVFLLCASLLAVNWLTYLVTITTKQVLQASLGYFLAPLITILCARIFLKEQLNTIKIIALALAFAGVVWLAMLAGHLPWLGIVIALTWGVYGLVRKLAPLPALLGFTVETLLLLPITLLFLTWHQANQTLVFLQLSPFLIAILVGSGLVTMIPLLLFASASKKIPLSLLGILQYITPTIQFLLGIFVFHELFDLNRFIGYVWVWLGVALFVYASFRHTKNS